jgi:hypothetical protein
MWSHSRLAPLDGLINWWTNASYLQACSRNPPSLTVTCLLLQYPPHYLLILYTSWITSCHTQAPRHDALVWRLYIKGKQSSSPHWPISIIIVPNPSSLRCSSERLPYYPSRRQPPQAAFISLLTLRPHLFSSTTSLQLTCKRELRIQLINHLIHIWIQRLPWLSPCPSSAV